MKKYLIFLLCTLVALPILARDFEYTYQGQTLTYEILDEEAKTCQTKSGTNVGSGNKISGELVIPQIVKNGKVEYSVVSIGNYSFSNSKDLTSVTIPNHVNSIGAYAFNNCSSLTSLTIPNSVNSIGFGAFASCFNLKNLLLEDGTEILTCSKGVFTGCHLETIYLGRNLSYDSSKYDESPFYKMVYLKNLTISPSVTSIGPYAFSSCNSMTSVTIPNSVTTIGEYAFSSCNSMTSVTIPDKITTIPKHAFRDCSMLSTISIPTSVTDIDDNAFSFCKSLSSVSLHDGIVRIGKKAFRDCSILSSISIPASVSVIDDNAFSDCKSLSSVSLHEGLVRIGNEAFANTGLTTITLPSSLEIAGQGVFSGSKLSSVNMPDSFFTNIEAKKSVFGGTPYFSEIKDSYEAELKKTVYENNRKKIIGSWTLQIGDRNIAVYTFKSDNTYTAKYTNYLHNPSGCFWTFTETGKWEQSGDKVYVTSQTFTRPTVKVSAMANWQQKKMPSVISQMTQGEYSSFLKEHVTRSGERNVFELISDSKMAVKMQYITTTWGYLIKNSVSGSTASGKKSATPRKKTGKR